MSEMPEFFQFLASMGVGGILAGFMFHVHNKTLKDHAEVLKGYHEVEKGRTDLLMMIVKDNTNATAKNNTLIDALHRRLDKEEHGRKDERQSNERS